MADKLKANKIRREQKKIFQNWYSTELHHVNQKKIPYETSHCELSLKIRDSQYLAKWKKATCEESLNARVF